MIGAWTIFFFLASPENWVTLFSKATLPGEECVSLVMRGDLLGVDSFVGVLVFEGVLVGVLREADDAGGLGGGDMSLDLVAAVATPAAEAGLGNPSVGTA